MATAFKAFVAILSALFIVVSGFSIIVGFGDAVAAYNYVGEVSNLIVESYYNEQIIAECVADALEKGYELTVSVEGEEQPGCARYMRIEFKYDFSLKLFGYTQEKKIVKVL